MGITKKESHYLSYRDFKRILWLFYPYYESSEKSKYMTINKYLNVLDIILAVDKNVNDEKIFFSFDELIIVSRLIFNELHMAFKDRIDIISIIIGIDIIYEWIVNNKSDSFTSIGNLTQESFEQIHNMIFKEFSNLDDNKKE